MKFREYINEAKTKICVHFNDTEAIDIKNVQPELFEGKDFYRLPKKIIDNELYVLKGLFENLYSRNSSGNDFKPYMLDEAEKMIKTIKKTMVKNPTEAEMEKLEK